MTGRIQTYFLGSARDQDLFHTEASRGMVVGGSGGDTPCRWQFGLFAAGPLEISVEAWRRSLRAPCAHRATAARQAPSPTRRDATTGCKHCGDVTLNQWERPGRDCHFCVFSFNRYHAAESLRRASSGTHSSTEAGIGHSSARLAAEVDGAASGEPEGWAVGCAGVSSSKLVALLLSASLRRKITEQEKNSRVWQMWQRESQQSHSRMPLALRGVGSLNAWFGRLCSRSWRAVAARCTQTCIQRSSR